MPPKVRSIRPKIRSIRPEKILNEYGPLSDSQYRLMTGMTTVADDEGRLVAAPEVLRAQIWGHHPKVTPRHVERDLRALARHGLVKLYSANGRRCVQLLDWDQRIDRRWRQDSQLPPPPESRRTRLARAPRRSSRASRGAATARAPGGHAEPTASARRAHATDRIGPDRRGQERTGGDSSTPPTPPRAGGQRVVILPALALHAMRGRAPTPAFMAWWARYPRQEGLLPAWRAWQRRGCEAVADQVLAALEAQLPALRRESGRFAPGPAKYLREGRWLDPPPMPAHVLTPATAGNVDVLRRFVERGVGP